ncbi:unnamed protein product [Staurois parvus]|uniref:Uncharacterized protein n=1 Tax=Staurois parvus TaxID=386267 RepID=A0ABN9E119_9NEOB|nr:unnamed protein product [Staurois parvus]
MAARVTLHFLAGFAHTAPPYLCCYWLLRMSITGSRLETPGLGLCDRRQS